MIKDKYKLLTGLCLIHFLLGLDINIVSVSLTSIAAQFNVSPVQVTQIIWIYFLVIICLLPAFGKAGDIKGFRKIYISGIIVFITGSMLASVPVNFYFLLSARVIQAAGAAALFSLTPAIIAFYFTEDIRGRIFGVNYTFTALGGITGRAVSGYLITELGWNSVFYVCIPLGLAALFFIYKYLPENIPSENKGRFDIKGTILISSGLFLLMVILNTGNEFGWFSPFIIFFFIFSVLLIIAFIKRQLNSESPLIDLKILKEKNISFPVASFLFVYLITNGMIYIVPFFLQWIKLISKEETGLLMAIPSAVQLFSGFLSGKLSENKSKIVICSAALVLLIFSLILHLQFSGNSSMTFIIISLSLYGFATGFFIPANTNKIMTYAPENSKGSVSGLMTTSVRLGSSLGALIFGTVFSSFVPFKNPLKEGVSGSVMLTGFRGAFFAGIISAFIALILILLTRERKLHLK